MDVQSDWCAKKEEGWRVFLLPSKWGRQKCGGSSIPPDGVSGECISLWTWKCLKITWLPVCSFSISKNEVQIHTFKWSLFRGWLLVPFCLRSFFLMYMNALPTLLGFSLKWLYWSPDAVWFLHTKLLVVRLNHCIPLCYKYCLSANCPSKAPRIIWSICINSMSLNMITRL